MLRLKGARARWARSLGLDGLLAAHLPLGTLRDPLGGVRGITEEAAAAALRRFVADVPAALSAGLRKLRSSAPAAGRAGPGAQELGSTGGSTADSPRGGAGAGGLAAPDDVCRGPEELIGAPNPRVMHGMELEHCRRGNCRKELTAARHNFTTTPALEWEFVVLPREGFPYPHSPRDKQLWVGDISWRGPLGCRSQARRCMSMPVRTSWKGACGRDVEDLTRVLGRPEVRRAGLVKEEVVGLRLCTGPMLALYGAALRECPDRDVFSLLTDRAGRENRYETTLFAVASGIAKLSRVAQIPPGRRLFRGLGGTALPARFWEPLPECQVAFAVFTTERAARAILRKLGGIKGPPALEQEEADGSTSSDDLDSEAAAQAREPPAEAADQTGADAEKRRLGESVGISAMSRSDDQLGEESVRPPTEAADNTSPASSLSTRRASNLYLSLQLPEELACEVRQGVGVRVVKDAQWDGAVVRMSVALPLAKEAFDEQLQRHFQKAVQALCGGGEVRIEEVTEKPGDFRGGGKRQPPVADSMPAPAALLLCYPACVSPLPIRADVSILVHGPTADGTGGARPYGAGRPKDGPLVKSSDGDPLCVLAGVRLWSSTVQSRI